MSSPVTSLSNFNGIDFNVILNAVMQQANLPLQDLQTRQTNLSSEKSAYGVLATKLGALETAAATLSTTSGAVAYAATVSDTTAITVGPTSTAVAGNYNVVVTSLAQAQVTASSSTTADADTTAVATGCAPPTGGVTVTVRSSLTLPGLATQINATTGMTATASVVDRGPGAFKLMLTGTNTGGQRLHDHQRPHRRSWRHVRGQCRCSGRCLPFGQRHRNHECEQHVDRRDSGATLTLLRADAAKTVAVPWRTTTRISRTIQSFVSAYNDLAKFVSGQNTSAASGKAGTARAPASAGADAQRPAIGARSRTARRPSRSLPRLGSGST